MTPGQAVEILAVFEQADDYESLSWRVTKSPDDSYEMRLFANCSDLFFWATADCEEVEFADLGLLNATLADLRELNCEYLLPELFACRKRKLRPQAPAYKNYDVAVRALFDACCTEEERADADRKDRQWWLAFAATQAKRQQKGHDNADSR